MAESGRKRFNKFHERISQEAGCDTKAGERLPFAPDFLDNLVCRIATGDLAEAVMDWTIYRASGNQQKYAIHLYGHNGDTPVETRLGQADCALELAWLAAWHPPEWLDAPLELFRAEAARREVVPIDKSLVSEAFTFNRRRGTIARDTGYFLTLVPSPRVGDSTETRRTKGESPEYRKFLAEWEVAHSAETEEERVARSIIKRINKVRLSAYRDWKRSRTAQTNGGASLEALESSEPVGRSVETESTPNKATDLPTGAAPVENDLQDLLIRRLQPKLKDTPSKELVRRIASAMQGAPLPHLDHRITLKFATITSFGLIEKLAKDVGDAWIKVSSDERKANEENELRQRQRDAETTAEIELHSRVSAALEKLPAEDRAERLRKAKRAIREGPLAASWPLLTEEQRNEWARRAVIRELREEMQAKEMPV